jgi:hypothetical protein
MWVKDPVISERFFNAILMTPPRRQNEDLKHLMAAWDCLSPDGGFAVASSARDFPEDPRPKGSPLTVCL